MKDYKPSSNDMLENIKNKEMDKHGVPPTKRLFFITESLSLTRSLNLVVHGKRVKIRSNIRRNVTTKMVLHTVIIHLEIRSIMLRQLNSTVRKDPGDGKRARPTGLYLSRENLQARIKEQDLIIDIKNAVLDLRVMWLLCSLFVDHRILISLITKLTQLI
nr:hypothetical protein [Tanacetum cinerariifolium]